MRVPGAGPQSCGDDGRAPSSVFQPDWRARGGRIAVPSNRVDSLCHRGRDRHDSGLGSRIAGLTWLTAAARDWTVGCPILGALPLAFASSLHDFSWPAIAGTTAFLASARRDQHSRIPFIRALCGVTIGAGTYLIPCVIGFEWPERDGIAERQEGKSP
jgi:hypothetical protein